jgi:hypothetical protein
MTTCSLRPACCGIPLLLAACSVQAQTTAPAATAPPDAPAVQSAVEDWLNQVKQPLPWLTWGGDFRIRNEYFNNALSLTTNPSLSPFSGVHEQDYFRFRGRLWASIMPTEDLSFNVRLSAEPREFLKPSTMDSYLGQLGMQWRYGIFDNLNVQWKKPLDLPATVKVGRQDIFLGDGWLVGDGTPDDGSFTSFLDSARITYELKDLHTTIDAIGIIQCARPDGWLPTIGSTAPQGAESQSLLLTDQNEKGAILWVANKSLPAANLDGYFIYKQDTRLDNQTPPASFGDYADIYTIGGRVSGLLKDHWKYSIEGAYQFGQKQDPELNGPNGNNPLLAPGAQTTGFRNINAFGAQTKLTYLLKDQWNNQFTVSYEFLSGDNPKTGNDEMFDVLWGRWPAWSEMYNIYSYVQETRVGQTANLHRLGPTWSLDPIKDMNFSLSYYALFADQDVPTRDLNETFIPSLGGPATLGPYTGTGNFRGHYIQAVLKYKFSKHVSGHLWSEFLLPGDFYVSRDTMSFLRAEMMFTF